jgi:hypothetical protein
VDGKEVGMRAAVQYSIAGRHAASVHELVVWQTLRQCCVDVIAAERADRLADLEAHERHHTPPMARRLNHCNAAARKIDRHGRLNH